MAKEAGPRCIGRRLWVVTVLLSSAARGWCRGADIDAKTNYGLSALRLAIINMERIEAVVKRLLEAGADINAMTSDGQTPMQYATVKGYDLIVKLLLEAGAEVDATGDGGRTPLQLAVFWGYASIVELLVDSGADMNTGGGNETLLRLAASKGYESIVPQIAARVAGCGKVQESPNPRVSINSLMDQTRLTFGCMIVSTPVNTDHPIRTVLHWSALRSYRN